MEAKKSGGRKFSDEVVASMNMGADLVGSIEDRLSGLVKAGSATPQEAETLAKLLNIRAEIKGVLQASSLQMFAVIAELNPPEINEPMPILESMGFTAGATFRDLLTIAATCQH